MRSMETAFLTQLQKVNISKLVFGETFDTSAPTHTWAPKPHARPQIHVRRAKIDQLVTRQPIGDAFPESAPATWAPNDRPNPKSPFTMGGQERLLDKCAESKLTSWSGKNRSEALLTSASMANSCSSCKRASNRFSRASVAMQPSGSCARSTADGGKAWASHLAPRGRNSSLGVLRILL